MFYYEIEDDYIIKYEVTIDREAIETLKKTVMDNCSEIIKMHEHVGMEPPKLSSGPGIRYSNIEKEATYDGSKFKDYKWSYTEYKDSKLVSIIDQLLEGKASVIWELKHPKERQTNKEILEGRINQYLPVNQCTKFGDLKSAISDYEEYLSLNTSRLRKSDTVVFSYYPQVLSFINLNKVCSMSIEDAKEAIKFFGAEFEYLNLNDYEARKDEANQQVDGTSENVPKQKRV